MAPKKLTRDAATGQFVPGREAFATISAVEGSGLSKEAEARLAELDRRGVTGDARRQAVSETFRQRVVVVDDITDGGRGLDCQGRGSGRTRPPGRRAEGRVGAARYSGGLA